MKVVFFGTSRFAANLFSFLVEHAVDVVACVTRPDRPVGRSLKVAAPPVKEVAQMLKPGLPIHQPEKASTAEFAQVLRTYDADLFVVVAYGEILKQNILDLPKLDAINVHASLLPKYRGAAPIQRCLMEGCTESGITIIEMVLAMDAGDMLEIVKTPISPEMTFGELEKKLCELAGPALLKVIGDFKKGSVKRIPQDPALVTLAPKITPSEEQIDWKKGAAQIHNQIRALSPRPGAWCFVQSGTEKKRLKILRSKISTQREGTQAQVLSWNKEACIVACGEGALQLLEVQLEGKKALPIEDFIRGLPTPPVFVVH